MPIVSRGFRGRRPGGDANRLPPGQYLERDFPVLSAGPTPRVDVGHFSWSAEEGGPLFLVGGGSGVVPFRAMLRHRAAAGRDVPARLLLSARRPEAVYYRDEWPALGDVRVTLTREAPAGWPGETGRVDAAKLERLAPLRRRRRASSSAGRRRSSKLSRRRSSTSATSRRASPRNVSGRTDG